MKIYFSGGSTQTLTDFMKEHNCARLFSYYNDKKMIEQKVCEDVFVDCGAWTAYNKKVSINIDDYVQYLDSHKDYYTVAASLDVIPHGDFENCAEQSYNNFICMRKQLKNNVLFIPTYHKGEHVNNLIRLLQYCDDCGQIDYIGIGGMAGIKNKDCRRSFLDVVFNTVSKYRPEIKIHLFGLTDLSLLEFYTPYSVDSTTWLIAGAMGEILTDFGRIKISDKKSMYLQNMELNFLAQHVQQHGFEIDTLSKNIESRQMFNILYMKSKVENFTGNFCSTQKSLF